MSRGRSHIAMECLLLAFLALAYSSVANPGAHGRLVKRAFKTCSVESLRTTTFLKYVIDAGGKNVSRNVTETRQVKRCCDSQGFSFEPCDPAVTRCFDEVTQVSSYTRPANVSETRYLENTNCDGLRCFCNKVTPSTYTYSEPVTVTETVISRECCDGYSGELCDKISCFEMVPRFFLVTEYSIDENGEVTSKLVRYTQHARQCCEGHFGDECDTNSCYDHVNKTLTFKNKKLDANGNEVAEFVKETCCVRQCCPSFGGDKCDKKLEPEVTECPSS